MREPLQQTKLVSIVYYSKSKPRHLSGQREDRKKGKCVRETWMTDPSRCLSSETEALSRFFMGGG